MRAMPLRPRIDRHALICLDERPADAPRHAGVVAFLDLILLLIGGTEFHILFVLVERPLNIYYDHPDMLADVVIEFDLLVELIRIKWPAAVEQLLFDVL